MKLAVKLGAVVQVVALFVALQASLLGQSKAEATDQLSITTYSTVLAIGAQGSYTASASPLVNGQYITITASPALATFQQPTITLQSGFSVPQDTVYGQNTATLTIIASNPGARSISGTFSCAQQGTMTLTITMSQAIGQVGSTPASSQSVTCGTATPTVGPASSVTIAASPTSVSCNGTAFVTVTVRNSLGGYVTDGTSVSLTTSMGSLSPTTATTLGGGVLAVFTAPSNQNGTAFIQASAAGTALGSASISVNCSATPPTPPVAAPASSVTVAASPTTVSCNGTTFVTVTVRNSVGGYVADGIGITLTSTIGSLSPTTATTLGGGVLAVFTAPGNQGGTANIQATAAGMAQGSASITVNCNAPSTPAVTPTILVAPPSPQVTGTTASANFALVSPVPASPSSSTGALTQTPLPSRIAAFSALNSESSPTAGGANPGIQSTTSVPTVLTSEAREPGSPGSGLPLLPILGILGVAFSGVGGGLYVLSHRLGNSHNRTFPERLSHYALLEALGAGGMGTVFRARDENTGQIVAVKTLHPHLAADSDYVDRFEREARIAQSIDSPNVVRVLDSGYDKGICFLVMEFVPGTTLAELVAARGRMSVRETTSISASIARGLAAANSKAIVHRDLSPQNVIITPDGRAKVTDFGVSRDLTQTTMTATGMLLGKPHYIAPEVFTGAARADIRADIYALGIIIFQMLAGEVPFNAETPYAVMQKHVNSPTPALRTIRSDVPHWLATIVERCLAKDPAERFQAPESVLEALRAPQYERTVRSPRTPGA